MPSAELDAGRVFYTDDGAGARAELVHSAAPLPLRVFVEGPGTVRVYDGSGRLQASRSVTDRATITLRPGGFAIVG